jgi:hypothetical protein
MRDTISWVLGPALGVLLIAASIVGNSGPGFFLLALVAGVFFTILVPIMQLGVRRTAMFAERPIAAFLIALAVALGALLLVSGAAIFNQW